MKKIATLFLAASLTLPFFAQNAFYEGNGGKGLSIEVTTPKVVGRITDEQDWFPDFAANMIHDDMEKYSAIKMVDNINLESQMDIDDRNLNSGLFGGSTQIDYQSAENTLFITLTVIPNGYNLSVRVNKSNTTKASYNQNHTVADMESGLAIKSATAEILEQLGVRLTKEGKDSLLAVNTEATQHSVEAQKLYAQGNVAMQKGSKIEALSYFIQANTSDSSLERAMKSMSEASTSIAAGDIGTQARNAIQQRKQFQKIIADIKKNFEENPPFILVYKPDIKIGNIDYERELINLSMDVSVVRDLEKMRVRNSIIQAFNNAPDSEHWGINVAGELGASGNFGFTVSIADKSGKVVGERVFKNVLEIQRADQFAACYSCTVPISADVDTSTLALFIKDVTMGDTSLNTSRLKLDDYVNKIFVRSIAKEEIAEGSGIFVITIPICRSNSYVFSRKSNSYYGGEMCRYDVGNFFHYFCEDKYSLDSLAFSVIKGNFVNVNLGLFYTSGPKYAVKDLEAKGVPNALTYSDTLRALYGRGDWCSSILKSRNYLWTIDYLVIDKKPL